MASTWRPLSECSWRVSVWRVSARSSWSRAAAAKEAVLRTEGSQWAAKPCLQGAVSTLSGSISRPIMRNQPPLGRRACPKVWVACTWLVDSLKLSLSLYLSHTHLAGRPFFADRTIRQEPLLSSLTPFGHQVALCFGLAGELACRRKAVCNKLLFANKGGPPDSVPRASSFI